jgi:ATP-dependent Clp protease ATP-binding subunit ClpC
VLDDGQLTDGLGRKVDFRNTIIIMTSNVGARQIDGDTHVGFKQKSAEDVFKRIREDVSGELKRTFNPEFLNRVDETVIFHPLEKEHLVKIVDLQLARLNNRVKEQGLELVMDDEVKEWITEKGYDPAYGARPMRRTIQKYIEAPLSDEIIRGTFREGERIYVYLKDGAIAFKEAPALAEV